MAIDLKEQAKKVKILTLYTEPTKKYGAALQGRCPFHKDSGQPNFYIYPATNSFYCFRCGTGGDVIQFYRMLKQVNFLTAIKELSKIK